MGEMLSQDEINALLTGMDLSEDAGKPSGSDGGSIDESLLTPDERDAIGEIANISMGSSATTLYSLLNRKVNITTPVVTMANWDTVVADYERPCVFIQIRYTSGLDGSNIMILKEHDVKVITDLMMGGDGSNTDGELGELHLSAISEAMNQMMGSAATSMSTMLGKMIDISPPEATLMDLNDFKSGGEIASFLEETFVKISFRMQVDDLIDSTIMQLYPVDFAGTLYDTFMSTQAPEEPAPAASEPTPAPAPAAYEPQAGQPNMGQANVNMGMGAPQMDMGMQMNGMQGMPQMGMPQMYMNGGMGMPQMYMGMPQTNMQNIQPVQFQSFNNDLSAMTGQENIGLIKDVPLDITVELGRTKKSISEILDFAPGTIIELDKIAGEPIDVLVNGKLVAKGEVVVIEEN